MERALRNYVQKLRSLRSTKPLRIIASLAQRVFQKQMGLCGVTFRSFAAFTPLRRALHSAIRLAGCRGRLSERATLWISAFAHKLQRSIIQAESVRECLPLHPALAS